MLTEVRQKAIADYVLRNEVVTTTELSQEFNVSEMTIRRDLKKLEEQGSIRRTHGGALSTGHSHDIDLRTRATTNHLLKKAIAQKAAEFIGPHETVLLDVGSTMEALARELPTNLGLTVVTNGIMIVNALLDAVGLEVYMLGGSLQHVPQFLMGPSVFEKLQNMQADKAFIASSAFSLEGVVTDSNVHQAEIKRRMMKAATQTYLVLDSSKIGHSSLNFVAGAEDFDVIIIDEGVDMTTLKISNEIRNKFVIASTHDIASIPDSM